MDTQQQAEQWNEQHPIGTAVSITNVAGVTTHTVTTSPAMLFAKTEAVVFVRGRVGFFNLNRLTVIAEPQYMTYKCNVSNCGGGKCVHKLLDERCPHCDHRMVEVTTTGFKFCSNPDYMYGCDYDIDAPIINHQKKA